MSNVKKGNVLEEKAIDIIYELIDKRLLQLDREFVKIYSKKKYPSSIRKGKIEFDLSIEVWPPNADRYSMIYLIECKNYTKRVPSIQVKKFYDDIIETQGVNAKGILITNSPLQKGAYELAEVRRMMVIEAESNKDFKLILYKNNREAKNSIPIIHETLDINLIDDGIKIYEKLIDKEILNSLILTSSSNSYGVNQLSKLTISNIAEAELNKINQRHLIHAESINVDIIIKYIKTEYGIKTEYFKPNKENYLGRCNIVEKTIGISKTIAGTERELFVLCHEFGHFILHQKLSINQVLLDSFSDSEINLSTGKTSLNNPNHWIEWQANYFSASLILPRTSLIAILWKSQLRRDLPKNNLYIDDQLINRSSFYSIVEYLSIYFHVSKTSILYRLEEFKLIDDKSRLKRINELIIDYKSSFFN